MIIEQVNLKNYRQYKDNVVFNFGMTENENVNVVIGSTGAGKTNLSNAIQWCFYGEEPMSEDIDFGMLNMETFESLKEGEVAEVSVEVIIRTNKEEKYSFIRTKKIEKRNRKQKITTQSDDSVFKAYFHRANNGLLPSMDTHFPASMINQMAPKKIREYFFFNGEKLEKYFTSSTNEKIKESIFKISQLDLLEIIEERLGTVIQNYRQDSKRITPELGRIAQEIKELEENLKMLNLDKTEIKKQSKELEDELVNFTNKYKKVGGLNTKNLLIKNEKLTELIDEQRNKLNEVIIEKRNLLLRTSHFFIGLDAFIQAENFFIEAEEKKQIPPSIDPQFVKNLLKDEKCICGENIGLGNDCKIRREKVEKLLAEVSKLGYEVGNLLGKKSDMVNISKSRLPLEYKNLESLNERIKYNKSSLYKFEQEYNENKAKVGEHEIAGLENFEGRINDLTNEIKKLAGKKSVLEQKIEEDSKTYEIKKEELSEHLRKQEVGTNLNKCIQFCELAQKCVSGIKEKVMDEIRMKISEETKRHYKELHWKRGENIEIKIHDDYRITALQGGYNKFGAFSAGEYALLAMSFVFALNNISGFNVPIILDTALGRISTGPRANFAKNISRYLKDTQIILLLTQSEYSPEVEENLSSSIYNQQTIDIGGSPLEAVVKIN